MFILPNSTEFNKRIPKQKFYENLTVSPNLKRIFVEQIRTIYWRNKIASTTVNVAPGNEVTEVEVFEISLNQQGLDESVLRQIDKAIPYHILFLLTYSELVQAWIGYKETDFKGNVHKVGSYYHTEWMKKEKLQLRLEGLSMDVVYENFVRQIAGNALQSNKAESLKASVEKSEQKKQLEKQIVVLQEKIRKEKQLNRQMEYSARVKKLRKEMETI